MGEHDDSALMQFHAAELLEAHGHMDRAGIPQHDEDGEKLTISQRVKVLCDVAASIAMASRVIAKARG